MKKRILTGDNTTGKLHLGHYVGSIKNRIKHQKDYETFIILADMHALAYPKYLTKETNLGDFSLEVLKDNLSCGLNPNEVIFFNESGVPEIYELFTILSMFVSYPRIMRVPTIKEEIREKDLGDNYSMGYLNFPTLMAADILSVGADLVPVGEDQKPMLELTRDILDKMRANFGIELKIPEVEIGETPRLVGTDGKVKMTKSLNNTINLSDTSEEVKKKVMGMYTDPSRLRVTDPGKVEGNPVFIYHDVFNENKNEVLDLKERYTQGKVGDIEVKEKLYVAIEKVLEPIREKRTMFENDKILKEILAAGNAKVRNEASIILKEVKEKLNLIQ
jgi:tryptophanyl-tRNA synthetase